MSEAKTSKRSQGTARMEGILISRIQKFNARGKGFRLTDGYYKTWKVLAKRLAEAGKIEQRGAYLYIKNAPTATEAPAPVAETPAPAVEQAPATENTPTA